MATPDYIHGSGGCVCSQNILTGVAPLKWMFREPSVDPSADNGWRFLSTIDDETYINNPANMSVVLFNRMIEIEPAVMFIYDLPVGTDLQLVLQDGRTTIVDNRTGLPINV